MKKAKVLVATVAAAVMVMGAGYAYWTQTLTINNTVNTGYLDVQFVGAAVGDYDDNGHSDLVNVSKNIATDGQSMSFTVDKLYPGAGASLNFEIQNTGSVNAKVSNVTGKVTNNKDLADALQYTVDTVKIYHNSIWETKNITPVTANTVEDLAAKLTASGIKDINLAPGDKLMLTRSDAPGYDVQMPASITGSQFESANTTFDLGIDFTQVN